MKVFPVLDLLNGQVVRGTAGLRANYRRITSELTDSAHPLAVARAIREAFGFYHFYVADLDGILHQAPNFDLYRQLVDDGFELLLDAGIGDPVTALRVCGSGNHIGLSIGLETCRSPSDLQQITSDLSAATFSLDLIHGEPHRTADHQGWCDQPIEIVRQVISLNVNSILVLDLSDVGMNTGGSTDRICRQIRSEFPGVSLITGGGIRSRNDLERIASTGADAVLIASALHDGRLTPSDFLRVTTEN